MQVEDIRGRLLEAKLQNVRLKTELQSRRELLNSGIAAKVRDCPLPHTHTCIVFLLFPHRDFFPFFSLTFSLCLDAVDSTIECPACLLTCPSVCLPTCPPACLPACLPALAIQLTHMVCVCAPSHHR